MFELWKKYINDLKGDPSEYSSIFYSLDWIYFSKEEQTCFIEYRSTQLPVWWWESIQESIHISHIINILTENIVISSTNDFNKYLEIRNIIKENSNYKSFNFN